MSTIGIAILWIASLFVAIALGCILGLITRAQAMKKAKQVKEALGETEKQVEIYSRDDGFPDVLILRNLLETTTVTASCNKETGKVILRLKMVDDNGSHFSKTLEFEENQIIHDLEIL